MTRKGLWKNTDTDYNAKTYPRLYSCYCNMKQRASARGDNCNVHESWSTFKGFAIWALDNGYNESMCLCRTGDVGNYEPTNVRWDTKAGNLKDKKGVTYKKHMTKIDRAVKHYTPTWKYEWKLYDTNGNLRHTTGSLLHLSRELNMKRWVVERWRSGKGFTKGLKAVRGSKIWF